MKKLIGIISVLALLGSCAYPTSQLGMVVIGNTTEPVAVTEHDASNKIGRACGTNILGFIATGDFSIGKAKRSGGISKVATVDREVSSFLGIFAKNCTVVKGS